MSSLHFSITSLRRSDITKVSLSLLLAVTIIVASMEVAIQMTEKRLKEYAQMEAQQNQANTHQLANELFVSDYWVFNSFVTGFADIQCELDNPSDDIEIRYTIDSKTLNFMTVKQIYKKLRAFLAYNEDYYSAVMIFEPNIIPDAPQGIAAMVFAEDTVCHNLFDDINVYEHDLYKRVRYYDRPLRSSGHIMQDRLWVMTTAVPFFDETGRFIGEFWVDWNHHRTSQILSMHNLGADVSIAIIDSDCNIVAGANDINNARSVRDVALERENDKELVDRWLKDVQEHVQRNDSCMFQSQLGNDVYQTFLSPIRGSDYTLLFVKSEKQIYSEARRYTWLTNIIMLASILFVVACLVYIFHIFKRKNDENSRMSSELDLASTIQRSILPKNPSNALSLSNPLNYEVFGFLRPAKSVGGDLYDFAQKGDYLHFCIGDVSGKGMPAALVMTELCSLYRYISSHISEPQNIVTQINNALMERSDDSMFSTLFVGVLNLHTGVLEFCNAGHNPPILIRGQEVQGVQVESSPSYMPVKPNMPICAFADWQYQKETIQLHSGDRLFLYTDGVTEAKDENDHFFGSKATLASISRLHDLPFDQLVQGMVGEIRAFTGKAEQNDDIAMLCVEYDGRQEVQSVPRVQELHFDTVKNRVTEIVDSILDACNLKDDMRFRLAIEEPIQNIADYAYTADGSLDVEISILSSLTSHLIVTIIDHGIPFNPLESQAPDLTTPIAEREIGGLGIHFTKQIMEDISYKYENNQNILTLKYKTNEQ